MGGSSKWTLLVRGRLGSIVAAWHREFRFADTIRVTDDRRYVFSEGPEAIARTDGATGGRGWWKLDLRASQARSVSVAGGQVGVLLKEVEQQLGSTPRDTILGGFSQGPMVSANIAFRTGEPLRALVLLSGTFVKESTSCRACPTSS